MLYNTSRRRLTHLKKIPSPKRLICQISTPLPLQIGTVRDSSNKSLTTWTYCDIMSM